MPNLDKAFAGLSEPKDLGASFDKHLRELLGKTSESAVAKYAVALLDGDDPSRYPAALRHLGGEQANLVLRKKKDSDSLPAVWGARALRYVWVEKQSGAAKRLVVARVRDPSWRVAEMCTKVVRVRKLRDGADAVAGLTGHRLPRVRTQAVRALGVVGGPEHLPVIFEALSDNDLDVRREAKQAMEASADRLRLKASDLRSGRFSR